MTLLATPVAYSLFDNVQEWLRRERGAVVIPPVVEEEREEEPLLV